MTMSSYEGWDDDFDNWDLPSMRKMVNVVTATPQVQLDARPIADLRPIDEFGPPEFKEGEKVHSDITRDIDLLKEKRSILKEQIRNLRSYPLEDTYDNGTVLIWHEPADQWVSDMHGVAVKDRNKWYVAGEIRSYRWDELVSRFLSDLHFSEVEVVRPAGTE